MYNYFIVKEIVALTFIFVVFLSGCGRADDSTTTSPDTGRGIIFVTDRDDNWEIYSIQIDGSRLSRLTDNHVVDADPSWSPDGKWILFRSRRDGSSDIFQMDNDGANPRNLIKDQTDSFFDEFYPQMNPNGELIALYSDRFPVFGDCRAGFHHLAFMDRDGGAKSIKNFIILPGEQYAMSWSPDGHQLAFSSVCNARYSQIYIFNIEDNQVKQITQGDHSATFPDWSPDGMRLAFVSNQSGNQDIYILEIDSGRVTALTNHPAKDSQPSWSPDGKMIAFTSDRDGNDEIYIMGIDGGEPVNLTRHPASDFLPSWSPIE